MKFICLHENTLSKNPFYLHMYEIIIALTVKQVLAYQA